MKNYNCKHKSEAFASELKKNGAENVKLSTIDHNSGDYSHRVVVGEGNVYDTTFTPAVYSMPEDEYFDKISKHIFTDLK